MRKIDISSIINFAKLKLVLHRTIQYLPRTAQNISTTKD